ncbi:MAG TPA: PaaI family thioesterase [Actinomycetota bacterium]|nr:PaaI family thioesterase [Actinomycetota bacterium]
MEHPGLPYEDTIHETLGIHALEMDPDRVVLEMEVGPKVHQPMGLLHGGASAVLAESAASMGAMLNCEPGQYAVGIELNISHMRSARSGMVRATAVPVRKGRTIHVWTIDLVDEDGKGVAVGRCTLAIKDPRATA